MRSLLFFFVLSTLTIAPSNYNYLCLMIRHTLQNKRDFLGSHVGTLVFGFSLHRDGCSRAVTRYGRRPIL